MFKEFLYALSDTLKNNNSVMSYPMIENRVDKLFNALKGRRYLSKSVENQLIEAIMKLKADIIFIVLTILWKYD